MYAQMYVVNAVYVRITFPSTFICFWWIWACVCIRAYIRCPKSFKISRYIFGWTEDLPDNISYVMYNLRVCFEKLIKSLKFCFYYLPWNHYVLGIKCRRSWTIRDKRWVWQWRLMCICLYAKIRMLTNKWHHIWTCQHII